MDPKFTNKVMKTLAETLTAIKHERNLTVAEREKAANAARQDIQRALSEMPATDDGTRTESGAQPATSFLSDVYVLLRSAEMEGAKFAHFDRLDALRQQVNPAVAAA